MDTSAIRSQKGMVLVYVAIALMAIFAVVGLAVDSGHLFTVRGELQNAADAAALKGAWHLYTRPTLPTQVPTLQWNTAVSMAEDMIGENRSDHTPLTDAIVDAGFWNLDSGVLQPTTLSTPGPRDVAAVRVSTSRADGSNGGPVTNFFMQISGRDQTAVGSRPAVAVMGYPQSVPVIFPMALSSCMTDHYFNQDPMPDPPPPINIHTPYPPGGENCYTGQWTSLGGKNGEKALEDVLYGKAQPVTVTIGDSLMVQSGVKAAFYNEINTWLPEGGMDVIMPILNGTDLTGGEHTVTGFAAFHIDGAEGANGKYVYGHFIGYAPAPAGSTPGGPPTNTLTLPILVH